MIAPAPEPVPAKAEPVVAAPEPPVLERAADPITAPIAEVVALVPHLPADGSVAVASADATAPIPIPVRSRKSGMAKMGQPTVNRRALLAAGIVAAVLVSGGVIAKTVLAGSGSRPEGQSLAAASLLPTAGGTAQPQQAAVDPAAPGAAPVDSPAAAVDPTLTPQELSIMKVIWSREETMLQGRFRTPIMSRFKAVLGKDGMPQAFTAHTISSRAPSTARSPLQTLSGASAPRSATR